MSSILARCWLVRICWPCRGESSELKAFGVVFVESLFIFGTERYLGDCMSRVVIWGLGLLLLVACSQEDRGADHQG